MLSTIFLLPLLLLVSFTGAHTKNPKRGIGFASSVPGDIINANQTNSVISWQYNWATLPPDYLATSNIAYIPMQWGSVGVDSFSSSVKILGSNTILAFNEPDNIDEANMLPEEAASLWMQFLEPLKSQGIRLGGPAVTAAGSGRPWLTSFLSACSNCTIDFLPVHWYGTGFEGFAAYLGDVHNAFPKYPLWVTEYAETSNNDTEVLNFMNQTLTFLDGLDWVERYAWFGFFVSRHLLSFYLISLFFGSDHQVPTFIMVSLLLPSRRLQANHQ
ncbi:hypothetical protein CPC08DRAFT_627657 [Agrocybe pediades]|nr:hypothetical protein CPC08DRAFT_627657 [Agrocybe pediades]